MVFWDSPRPGGRGGPGRARLGSYRRTGRVRESPEPLLFHQGCDLHAICGLRAVASDAWGPSLLVALQSSHQLAGHRVGLGLTHGQRTEASIQTHTPCS